MRRERELAWSRPLFPYLGWVILGWILTWAAVELGMLQRLLYTTSLTGGQRFAVLGLVARHPVAVGIDDPAATPGQFAGQCGRSIQE
jgi:Ca2+-transporting ATPase